MKVILFIDNLGSGGAQRQLVGLAVMLKQHGLDVKVCTYFPQDFYRSYLDENMVESEIITGADNTKKRIWKVYQYFKKESPDWVISYQETPSLVACVAKLLGCSYKLLVSERNTTQVVGMNERVRFFLYRFADSIVPNSYSQENWLETRYPWMAKKMMTITNFVDLERFSYSEHLRHDVPEIVVAASLMQSKNAKGFIKACSILKHKSVIFHVSWYGISPKWSDYYKECLSLITDLGLEEYVSLLEKTQQIADKYRECDYFCLPSFFEGTPNVICEAAATGVPVACSNVCDNPRYVQRGGNGVLFDPRSPDDIAEKLFELLNQSDDEYLSFRRRSREIAETKFCKEQFLRKYLNIVK